MSEARAFAYAAHFGQHDRDGRPHIEHVLRVAEKIRNTFESDPYRDMYVEAAWLHDVVEDTDITFEYLGHIFDPVVVKAVRILTRDPDNSYFEYVDQVAESRGLPGQIARAIKLADLEDNLRRSEKDANDGLIRRYSTAKKMLGAK